MHYHSHYKDWQIMLEDAVCWLRILPILSFLLGVVQDRGELWSVQTPTIHDVLTKIHCIRSPSPLGRPLVPNH